MINYSQQLKSLVNSVLVKNPTLLDYIRDRKYKRGDTGLTYRQVNSLDQSGLLKDTRDSNKEWRNFNLNDLLYLHLIRNARLFNTGNAQLKYLKAMFYEQTINFKNVGELTFSEIALVALLASEQVPVGILLFSDGDGIFTDDPSISFSVGYNDIKKRTFIFIMLYQTFKPTIDKMKAEEAFKRDFDLSGFEGMYSPKPVTRKQRTLLNLIEEGDYSEINISKKKDGSLVINATKTINDSKLTESDIMKIFDEKSFANIKISKRDSKVTSYRLEDVIKL